LVADLEAEGAERASWEKRLHEMSQYQRSWPGQMEGIAREAGWAVYEGIRDGPGATQHRPRLFGNCCARTENHCAASCTAMMLGHRPQNCSCKGIPLVSIIFPDDDDPPESVPRPTGQRPLPTPKGRQMMGATLASKSRNPDSRGANVQSSLASSTDVPSAACASSSDVSDWICEQCTVVNVGADKRCAVCSAEKPAEKQETSTSQVNHTSDAKSALSKSSGRMASSAASALSALVGRPKRRPDDTKSAVSSAAASSSAASIPPSTAVSGTTRRRWGGGEVNAAAASSDRKDGETGSKAGSSNISSKGGSSNARPKGDSKSVISGINSSSNASAVLGPMLKAKPRRRDDPA